MSFLEIYLTSDWTGAQTSRTTSRGMTHTGLCKVATMHYNDYNALQIQMQTKT